ncbi:hypothetical protein LSTR_LSTR012064 [Laodelphax striatellus]|uniref:KAT8 regulatory NSL complex subunit 2 n=1 Tax=Laodelphax striatellus TaxID=195883 RepID=A0A482WR65_LAOST|nr:hypothetical protein LSTR_LSTR012064 [Laodelphax striatellus]
MYRCALLNQAAARKAGTCKHASRVCQKASLDGFEYCQKHILDDKNAPFKNCGYVYPINGKKCVQPAPKGDRKEGGFCAIHAKKSQLLRQKAGGRHCPPQTIENLLSSLSHYAPSSSAELPGEEESDNNVRYAKNPFVGIDANKVNSCGNRILDYVSESDSDVEPATLENIWKDADRDSSDAESIDSQEEDPLKHAGVYTAEEAAGIMREKLIRLKTLYVDQLKRLHHILKEKKRKYHYSLVKEKETLASIHSQSKTSPKELKLYEKLKALNRFHKHSGLEAVMHHKIKEKRNQAKKIKKFKRSRLLDPTTSEGLFNTAPNSAKCSFSIGGVKCGLKTLPSSKFCRKHILHDPHQVLFRPCGCERAEVVCQEPTLDVFEKASCMLHVTLPPLPQLTTEPDKEQPENIADEKTEIKLEPPPEPEPVALSESVAPPEPVALSQPVALSDRVAPSEPVAVKKSIAAPDPVTVPAPEICVAEIHPAPESDVKLEQASADMKTEEPAAEKETPTTNDVVMDDIMASNVDVVEEVIMSESEADQSANENVAAPPSDSQSAPSEVT